MSRARTTRHEQNSEDRDATSERQPFFWHPTFAWCLVSILLFWLSFPPVNWWLLAWIAPYGWIRVISARELTGRRPRTVLYLAGWLHWLAMTYWVTLPHPLAALGWLVLALYLACFVVGFILLARFLVHRTQVTPMLAVPTAWVTMELLRTYLFTGFGLVSLSHSQVEFHSLVQIANFTGAYGVSFVVVMVATAITMLTIRTDLPLSQRCGVLLLPACVLAICVAYSRSVLSGAVPPDEPSTRVAIIQGSLDTEFPKSAADSARIQKKQEDAFADYSRMTSEVTSASAVDLVLWPESMFSRYYGVLKYDAELADRSVDANGTTMETMANLLEVSTKQHIQLFGVNCLMGSNTTHYQADQVQQFNSAAFYNADGKLVDVYHKMHPVMFGEYIPLGDTFPWLYRFAPIPGALTAGEQPKAFRAGALNVAPCICFENTVPHLVRRNVLRLEQQGAAPTALATLTNDGWFWGSAVLDLHLACGIYRAIENRRPMLIAANTGISAHIDGCGRVLQATPKRASRVLVATVQGEDVWSFYTQYGDCFGLACVVLSLIGILLGYVAQDHRST